MPEVFSMMDKVKINKKNREADTLFLMTIGVLLAWSIVAALINTTMFNQSHVVGLARVFVVTGVFRLALAGRTRRWISLALVVAGILFIVVGFVTYPPDYFLYEPKRANQAADFIRRTIRYINGNEIFRQSYETAMIWAMSIIAGLFVTIFGYFYFKFLVLFLVPAATFGILLISRFFDLRISFFVFIFCSVAYLVKHLNQKCGDKSKGKASFASYALFVAIFCVGIAAIMPVPGARFRHNLTQTAVSRPFHHVNDTIYFAFGPRYFALGQVGFGGSGQLGGDIVRNERLIMRLRADREAMPIYLTGAILDTYTGSWWLNSFWERTPVDFGEMQQNIDLYERATSQMTAWMLHAPIANVMDDVSYLALARVRQREAILADLESGLNLGVDLWGAVLPDFDAEFVQASLVEVIIENIELVTSGGSGLGFNINWDNLPASDLEVIIADLGTVINLYTNEGVLSELYFVLDFRPGIGVMGSDFLFLSARARPIERRVRTLAETEHFYLDIGEDMFTTRTMDIDILNYRTFSVFYAGILQDIASSNPNVNFFRDRNGRIVAHERMPRNTVYTVQFSDLND
ncbi:MAG: hypothetical protein FWC90_05135, partial [Oscillospiraceae bacterium]|nr:hypothetical protein [Oscillospiraceae bacterium]